LILINNIVLEEIEAFFRRILDSEAVPMEAPEAKDDESATEESTSG